MEDLLQQVRQFINRRRLCSPGAVLVVGVSGGPDSLCLLHVLRSLAPELRLTLHVAHLHHGLRGVEADADAQFVADLANAWGLPCTVGRADVRALAREAGLSLEEAARQARYRFLAQVAAAVGAGTIAVGHNADDQAETVLMHFLRGSGVAGLRGMLPATPLAEYRLSRTADDLSVQSLGPGPLLIRPLLAVSRSAILDYCMAHDLAPRFDRSNEDLTIFRNRLRHELLPLLATYNPRIRQVLAHTAEVLAADYEVLADALETAWRSVAFPAGDRPAEVCLDLAGFRQLSLGMQRAVLRRAIRHLRQNLRNINWEHVERAVWLAREGTTGQRATLAAGLELTIGYRELRVGPEQPAGGGPSLAGGGPPQVAGRLELAAPGLTRLGEGWHVMVERVARAALPADFAVNPDPWIAYVDAAVVPQPVLRPRQPGDRFRPQGMAGHTVRLNEFMINAKVPAAQRAGWPLLVGPAGIAWVCGLRLDETALVRETTQEAWRISFIRESGM